MNFQQGSFAGRSLVQTPDGLNIAVQEWGNPAGRAIVFIHGFSQLHLSWSRQYGSALAREFRLITYDLRGHGQSDKPLTPSSTTKVIAGPANSPPSLTARKRRSRFWWRGPMAAASSATI